MEVIPNDLANVRKCLLRVPYKSDNLKAVCRGWETMVSSPKFYTDRRICGTSEQLICLILRNRIDHTFVITVYDPVKGTSEMLSPIGDPHCPGIPLWCQCIAVNRKLVLIGRFHPSNRSLMKSVYIYDFESARWSHGTDMPTPRSFFACSVSSSIGLVYVAGRIDESYNPLASAEPYNVEEDNWEILPPMIQQRGLGCQGVFLEGNFMVLSGRNFDRSAEFFDPSEGTLRRWEDMWISSTGDQGESRVIVTSSGELFVCSSNKL